MNRLPASLTIRVFVTVLFVLLFSACNGTAQTVQPDRSGQPIHTAAVRQGLPTSALPTATSAPTPLPQLQDPIIWYMRGPAPDDLPRVVEQLNRVLDARGFNARVDIRPVEEQVFDQQMADFKKTTEAWDLVSLDQRTFPAWVIRGSLLPLTNARDERSGQIENRLESLSPGLWPSLPAPVWKVVQVKGKIYAVPNQGVWAHPRGIAIRADVVRALDLQASLDGLKSFQDLTPLLEKINSAVAEDLLKEKPVEQAGRVRQVLAQPDLLQPENAGYETLVMPFVIRLADPQAAIVNWYQTPEFRALADLRRQWQEAGYTSEDPLTPEQWAENLQAGRSVANLGQRVWPGSVLEQRRRFGFDWIDRPLSPVFLSGQDVLASLTGLNSRLAEDPERLQRVLMFVEWTHTDPEIYNLLAYGIEAQHWRWVDRQKKIIALEPGSRYHPDQGFLDQLGDRTLSYALSPEEAGLWEAVRRWNASAAAKPVDAYPLGFVFDSRPVAAEMAAVRGLTPELVDPLANGQVDNVEKGINTLVKSLEAAGLPAIQTELERQLAAWRSGQ